MPNPPATGDLRPSEAYRRVTGSLVYRLSELMFGSLLAAYSLGFVGAIAAHGNQLSAHGRLGSVLLALQYFCISASFAYLTTSFYLTYHVGILTMPELRFDRLGRDFTIAISQAFFFGLSMLRPAYFPVLLSFNFLLSAMRKNAEYKNLADRLYCPEKPRDFDALQTFREELAKLLQGKRQLSAWAPIGLDIKIYGVMAFVIGASVIGLCLALESDNIKLQNCLLSLPKWLDDKWIQQQFLVSFELVTATLIIMLYGSRVLRRRASFIGFPAKISGFRNEPPDPNVSHHAKASDQPQINNSAKRQDMDSDVPSDSQTDKPPLIDREFEALQGELETLCAKMFPED